MSELITEKMENAEQILVETEFVPEKIGTDTEQIDYSPEIISEIMPEKRRHRGQRGPDRTPRRINHNSMMNLKPFQQETIIEESTNVQISNKMMGVIGIAVLAVIIGLIIWEVTEWRNKISIYAE